MRIRTLLGSAALTATLVPALLSATAWADGPKSAYDNGGVSNASLDPGEEQMTADDENKARMKDLSDAYHNGYNARAKEDAETYASLKEQLKQSSKASVQQPPPLPPGAPGNDAAQVRRVSQPRVAQQALQTQPAYEDEAAPVQYAPAPRPRYRPAPMYAQAPAYDEPAEDPGTVVFQPYQPPPPVQYVPVYQPVYVSPPVVQQVVPAQYAATWPVYRPRYYGYGWR
ncbi:conserved exported hypothetical protein [Paraburkholderia piptadeniae]|uniref:Uncharacterized protein n=1 Tax=Paraburkholderia piptadeniae TaxID=1701573 RepID=A0A1N7SIV2_9BURK|nr:hypothetical protein [Paraburkholderia piptadeniae]SIT47238.1 conserved exported hypothetical protein [Paraburkholderia piptadeniae]